MTASLPAAATLSKDRAAQLAATLLRVTMGGLFLFHGAVKLFIFTPAGTAGYFQSIGLPGPLAYLTIAAELLGGLALIVGFRTRTVALALIPLMLGAAWFGHGSAGFVFSNPNGGWEFPAFWTVTLAVQALLGSGAYALDDRR
jgi:putative oxidoreductase